MKRRRKGRKYRMTADEAHSLADFIRNIGILTKSQTDKILFHHYEIDMLKKNIIKLEMEIKELNDKIAHLCNKIS